MNTAPRIAIVEDDADINRLLCLTLEGAGYEAHAAADGTAGLALIRAVTPTAVILDLMLPGMGGLDICRELQRDPLTADIPVIMLTARGEEIDRVVGLEMGASDYLVKPFSPRELLLRLKLILKRRPPAQAPEAGRALSAGGLVLSPEAHRLDIDGCETPLTATEFKLLQDLLNSRGKVRSREQLLDSVWGYSFEGYARTVDTHIRRLRQKLGAYAECVETVRGVGYRFTKD